MFKSKYILRNQQDFLYFNFFRLLQTSTEFDVSESSRFSSHESHNQHLEQHKLPDQPAEPKRLRVGVVGMPNAGKSTLINSLTGKRLLPTSRRIDTTQENVLSVLSEGDIQIEFQDTPGMRTQRKSKRLSENFDGSHLPGKCLEKADLAMVVVDLSEKKTSSGFLHPEVLLNLLECPDVPAILILNKIDKLSDPFNVLNLIPQLTAGIVDGVPVKREIRLERREPIHLPEIKTNVLQAFKSIKELDSPGDLDLSFKTERKLLTELRQCRGWPHFKEVFVISAQRRKNLHVLKKYLKSQAYPEPWKFPDNFKTDASPYDLVKFKMRATLLENLAEEVPYLTNIYISDWIESKTKIDIRIDLVCKKVSHSRFVQRALSVLTFGIEKRLKDVFPIAVEVALSVYTYKEYSTYLH